MNDLVFAPFLNYPFMAQALLGGVLLAIAAAPLGVFLILRRMSLVGDALGHAILPGAAGAALLSGGSTVAITIGAAFTGALVFIAAGVVGRLLRLPEDAGFAVFYLAALSVGVMIASMSGGSVDLERLLFGAALALDATTLWLAAIAAVVSIGGIAMIFRPLMLDTLDPTFLRTAGGPKAAGMIARAGFFALLALTSVASFHALGALMGVGLTILPAIAARYLARDIVPMMICAALIGIIGVVCGLLASYHLDAPAGAAIVLSLVVLAFGAALLGPINSVLSRAQGVRSHVSSAA